jgi:dTMP kinase
LRRAVRQSTLPFLRDRFEEEDQEFFARVAGGFAAVAAAEPERVRVVDGAGTVATVCEKIWAIVAPLLPKAGRW